MIMPVLILFILLFQLSTLADMPIFDAHAAKIHIADQNSQSDTCVTPYISQNNQENSNTSERHFQTGNNLPRKEEIPHSFSFDQIFYFYNTKEKIVPLWLNLFAILPINPLKESKIFDVELVPS